MRIRDLVLCFAFFILLSSLAFAEGEKVGTQEATVCCQKTNSGLFCQDVKQEDCAADSQFALPTACSSTTPCDPGYCYDSNEGTCLDNVPQMVCTENGGTWSSEKPEACNLGCCVLGDQASFVTLVRCKRLSNFYGLDTNFNPDIETDAQCILSARAEEKGACVFEKEFEKTCELVKRSECTPEKVLKETSTTEDIDTEGKVLEEGTNSADSQTASDTESVTETPGTTAADETNADTSQTDETVAQSPTGCQNVGDGVEFCPGMLCSAEELGTNCGPSEETTCLEGKEEVYFVDTCGNPGNIYDASKINDDNYWSFIKDKSEMCDPTNANINSQTCGNCNYLLGSYCSATSSETTQPTYGTNICIDLNCPASDMTGGEARIHGESWCGFDKPHDFTFQPAEENRFATILNEAVRKVQSKLPIDTNFRGSDTPVGSKFYRYICSHGDVIVEPCADFRQEECIENEVAGYREAACRVNRWQDCTSVFKKIDCENTDRRDCTWLDGIEYVLIGGLGNGSALDKSSIQAAKGELRKIKTGERELGACVPKTPPGLKFYSDTNVKEGQAQRGTGSPGALTQAEQEDTVGEANAICAQANAICPVTYEKGLIGGEWECKENCECLEPANQLKRAQLCMALGDCGPKVNYVDQPGRTAGYKIFEEELGKKK